MDEMERRLTAAMTARAEMVTEDDLGEGDLLVREPRRWPVLVAAAAVVLTIAGVVAAASWQRADPPARPTPPPSITRTVPTPVTEPTGPGLGAAPGTGVPVTPRTATTSITSAPPVCGGVACTLVSHVDIAGDRVELWAGPDGADWQVRAAGTLIGGAAPTFTSNAATLSCQVVAGRPVCLVGTWYLGDSGTEVGVERAGGGWWFTGATFATPYGAERVQVRDVGGDGSIEVVSVETMNDIGEWTAQVWRWNGDRLGCTPHVDAKEKLPGWPAVAPDLSTLSLDQCWGGA